ncbi:MAG: hypothetical protein ACTH3G_10630 [Citricoccus sp.]
MSPRWHRAAMACAGIGLLFLTGCGLQERQENEERSAGYGRQIEEELPTLVRAAGWDSIGAFAENSCLGYAAPEKASRETHWTAASGRVGVSEADAGQMAEQVQRAAEEAGWTSKEGNGPHGDRLYGASKGDITLNVIYRSGAGEPALSLSLNSPCLEMPAGHVMTRSGLDPMYGSSDPLYPEDDRSKFTNGKAKPLPE